MQRQRIRHFVLENFLFSDDPSSLDDRASLIAAGIVDSTGIHELVIFIEDAFKLSMSFDEMTPENFDSIESIDCFVSRKIAG